MHLRHPASYFEAFEKAGLDVVSISNWNSEGDSVTYGSDPVEDIIFEIFLKK